MSRLDASALGAAAVRAERELSQTIPEALTLLSDLIAQRARRTRLFHDRTGNLRNSIRPGPVTGSMRRGFVAEVIAGGTSGVRYAMFVHDGTKFMAPRRFMDEALREVSQGGHVDRVMTAAVDTALQRAGFPR